MSGIFISYRREDSAPYAGRLHDRLCAEFGADQVFMDVDDIAPGADFVAQIGAKVGGCDALIAVIGKNWLTSRNAKGQLRFADPNDFVGLELSLALDRGVLIVPVLVGGAKVPKAEELRGDLKPLAQRNALALNDNEFQRDVNDLVKVLAKVPALERRAKAAVDERRMVVRKRLFKRLLWKAPIILLLVSFAVWWQWSKEQAPARPNQNSVAVAKNAGAFTGNWSAEINYPWGVKLTERFFFQPEGAKLFGTASFLGVKRAIEDGEISGDTIVFKIRFEELADGSTRPRVNRYEGKLQGKEIHLRLIDDKGGTPVEVNLTRASDAKTAPQANRP
jgi:hypothetical protein